MNSSHNLPHRSLPFTKALSASGALHFLLGSALLGTIGVFVHEAHTDPVTTTWFRCAFGLIGLSLWMKLRGHTPYLKLTRATGPWIIAAGALMVINWLLFFAAIERTSAGVAVLLFNVQPMWLLLLGAIFLREKIGGRRVAAVMTAIAGLALATGIGEQTAFNAQQPGYWLGVAFCLIGAMVMAAVTLIAGRLRKLPAGVLAWWQCAIGTVTLWVWPTRHGWPSPGVNWLWLAGLGAIHTGLAYTLLYKGMARLPMGRIAVFQFVYPAVAIGIDLLFLGQRMSGMQMAGIVVVFGAICFAERTGRRAHA
jgi:drug/metabolite transporter (DMT)-like permease